MTTAIFFVTMQMKAANDTVRMTENCFRALRRGWLDAIISV